LAQKLQSLRDIKFPYRMAIKYVAKENPSDYLDTEDTEWSIETMNELTDDYLNTLGSRQLASGKKKAMVAKKSATAKKVSPQKNSLPARKVSKKKVSERAD